MRFLALLCVFLTAGAYGATPAPASASAEGAARPTILVLGDSLSAGYGMNVAQGWVALLAKRIDAQGYGYRIVNASSSGETTGGGRTRLPRALDLHQPAIVVIELGSNDGLRGLPLEQIRTNLNAMITLSKSRGARVLLLGMQIPPNYGAIYTAGFQATFRELAAQHGLVLVPFLMDGVALDSELMQEDDLHPNAAGQPRLLDNVWPFLEPMLQRNVNSQRSTPAAGSVTSAR